MNQHGEKYSLNFYHSCIVNEESMTKRIEQLRIDDRDVIQILFGKLDTNIKYIEHELGVHIKPISEGLQIRGESKLIELTLKVLNNLIVLIQKQGSLSMQDVRYHVRILREHQDAEIQKILDEVICLTSNGKPLRPKTLGQKRYIDAVRENDIVFGIGPAGTGKTYLAMAMAITAFKNKEVNRIILTRPAVEAGESLGFLPGDLREKVDPYLRPIYDALFEIMGQDNAAKAFEKGLIEVAPLAYMRGRTLDNAYIILDEAQNTTSEQMKMFLTRMGFGSKVVITGDITQIDLPRGRRSGLVMVSQILRHVNGVEFVEFTPTDIVRHPLVQRIIEAYEIYESNSDKSSN